MPSPLPADTRPPPTSSFGRIRIESVTTRLVLISVAIFVLDWLLFRQGIRFRAEGIMMDQIRPLLALGHFSPGMSLTRMELWRLLTWPFVHANEWLLLVNVAGLHCFGPVLEAHYGTRRFLVFCILCALGGLAAYAILYGTNYLIQNQWVPMFGLSAVTLGILVAAAHVAPDATATIYDLVPIRLRTLALVLLGLAVSAVFTWGGAAFAMDGGGTGSVTSIGGAAAHLGGGATGLLLIRTPQWVRLFDWRPFGRPPPF